MEKHRTQTTLSYDVQLAGSQEESFHEAGEKVSFWPNELTVEM